MKSMCTSFGEECRLLYMYVNSLQTYPSLSSKCLSDCCDREADCLDILILDLFGHGFLIRSVFLVLWDPFKVFIVILVQDAWFNFIFLEYQVTLLNQETILPRWMVMKNLG